MEIAMSEKQPDGDLNSVTRDVSTPSEFIRLKEMFESLCDDVNVNYRKEFRNDFERRFDSGAWAWDPITKAILDDQVDRLGEVIMGPIYTCAEYEWPSRAGFPMAPLIQLDLEKAGAIGGVNLGTGLLQIWMPHHERYPAKDHFIRKIPREFVAAEKLTPMVEIPAEMMPLQTREEVFRDEVSDVRITPAHQIIGYTERRYTSQVCSGIQDTFRKQRLKGLCSGTKGVAKRIKAFDKLLKLLRKSGREGCSPSNCHLFGTFYDVQYLAEDRPPPLFCFDNDEFGFMWGDYGTAQLFYKLNPDGEPEFSFDWSCF